MLSPALLDFDLTALLALTFSLLAFLTAVGGRRKRRFQLIRRYVALCVGFCGFLYFVPLLSPTANTYRGVDLIALFLYSYLECWLLFLIIHNEPLPTSRNSARDTAFSAFFLFWIIILLGKPRFILADTATMMAAESLTVTLLAIFQLETFIERSSFSQFMRSNAFYTLLGTLAYFSFSIPVFFLMMLLNLHDHPETMTLQAKELVPYVGFFLMIRKDIHALPTH